MHYEVLLRFRECLDCGDDCSRKETTTKHYEKAAIAEQLFSDGVLKVDIHNRLVELNDLRKDVQYGEPGEALANTDLDDVLAELETFLAEVEQLVRRAEGDE